MNKRKHLALTSLLAPGMFALIKGRYYPVADAYDLSYYDWGMGHQIMNMQIMEWAISKTLRSNYET